jgi:hypothetical protein
MRINIWQLWFAILNPVGAKKAGDPHDYPWSSHHHHHYLRPRGAPRWLALGEVLSGYGSRRDFHDFVLSGNELEFYASKRRSPILGVEHFISSVKEGAFSVSGEYVSYEPGFKKRIDPLTFIPLLLIQNSFHDYPKRARGSQRATSGKRRSSKRPITWRTINSIIPR